MKIGLIDVDGHNYPNLPLMKLSAYHKQKGDSVEWYYPLTSGYMDIVYMSKVFTFTPDYDYFIDAGKIFRGGTGYYYPDGGEPLPDEIEHIYPDYSIYGITDTAYGFLTRGCPRNCSFCIVGKKETLVSHKVADLHEFWNGQEHIELLDPNILACKDWKDLLQQLADSKAKVNFNQGLDIRMMTEEKAEMLKEIKVEKIHFAWDRIEDAEMIKPKFLDFRKRTKINNHNLQVYVLVGDRERKVTESDLYRIRWLKENGYAPYVMIFDKGNLRKGHELLRLQRWVNNRFVFWSCDWEEYEKKVI